MAWIYVSTKVDTHQQQESGQSPLRSNGIRPRQITDNCRRRGGSGCGGVSAMDGATEPTWTYSRRPPPPDPPRHPTECTPLPLLLLLIRQVQGAALPDHPRWLQQQPKNSAIINRPPRRTARPFRQPCLNTVPAPPPLAATWPAPAPCGVPPA
ncbi:hypothetical protein D3C73_1175860 [compost metagenome]